MIRFRNLTKNYGAGKGLFDLSFEIADGEAFGILGPKGAGKTSLFSQLMGFAAPGQGWCTIDGKNCHDHQDELRNRVGYLPEYPEFPGGMTGMQFIRFTASVRGVRSMEKAICTAEWLELNLDERTCDMTRSEKQRLGLVAALLHDPQILLLDDPAEGLEPLLRHRLTEIIQEEKRRRKTVLWASRMFEDMDRCCDRIGMLKNGSMLAIDDIASVRREKRKAYIITFETEQEALQFTRENVEIRSIYGSQVNVVVRGDLTPLIQILGGYHVMGFEGTVQPLEDIFIHFYGGDFHA